MIAKSTIEKVFESSRVEEVIGDFVQLKKSGSNYKGLSPFTEERTPSFMVSPAKQIWKDFSSGKGGTVVTFLMEHEHFTYPEAIKYLAKKYNIDHFFIDHRSKTREGFDKEISAGLKEKAVDLVLLIGFMRILSTPFIEKWNKKGGIGILYQANKDDFNELKVKLKNNYQNN